MILEDWLRLGVVVAAVCAVITLGLIVWRTAHMPRIPSYAPPAGSESRGVRYAFTKGMLPGEKESVRMHMPTFIGSALYHLGVFTAFSLLFVNLSDLQLPGTALWPIRVLVAVGLVSGLGLLVKRISLRKMRIISTPDDYAANVLVDLFLLFGMIATFSSDWVPVFLTATILLFVYLPLGKIRHCVLFFYTRVQFGRLFGRRGVLPHPAAEK